MRVFCCAWKINFPKTVCFNSFEPEIGFSQNFHFKSFPNSHAKREREREREREAKERAQITPRTQSPDHTFDFTDLRTHKLIFDLEPSTHKPSTSPTTQSLCVTNPQTDLSLCVILIDPRTDLRFCVILIFYFLSLIFDFFFFWLWWCFGGFPIVWWWVLCGWW